MANALDKVADKNRSIKRAGHRVAVYGNTLKFAYLDLEGAPKLGEKKAPLQMRPLYCRDSIFGRNFENQER